MKNLILLTFLSIFTLRVNAQIKDTVGLNLPIKDGKIYYEGVVQSPGKTKNQLFANAKGFLLETFVSEKAVIESEDKEEGNISGKGVHKVIMRLNFMYDAAFFDQMIIQIDCKDGRYRYRFYDFRLSPTGNIGDTPNRFPEASYDDMYNALIDSKHSAPYNKKQKIFLLKDNDSTVKELINKLNAKMTAREDSF